MWIGRTIQKLQFFKFSYILRWRAAAILDFQFDYFQWNIVVGDAGRNMHTKFGENPTYRSKIIDKIVFHWICEFVINFVNFKMAADSILKFTKNVISEYSGLQ